jgi:hypothetical protein
MSSVPLSCRVLYVQLLEALIRAARRDLMTPHRPYEECTVVHLVSHQPDSSWHRTWDPWLECCAPCVLCGPNPSRLLARLEYFPRTIRKVPLTDQIWMARVRAICRGSFPWFVIVISRSGSHCTRPLIPERDKVSALASAILDDSLWCSAPREQHFRFIRRSCASSRS